MRGDAFTPVPNRVMITISIMLANIMQGVENTILNVALPHIQGSLSASLDQVAWSHPRLSGREGGDCGGLGRPLERRLFAANLTSPIRPAVPEFSQGK